MEFRIGSFDTNKKTVNRSMGREARHIEYRMIRLRELVHGDHPENRKRRSTQHRQFKGNGDKCRPAVGGPSRNVYRITAHVDPKLKEEAGEASQQTPNESHKGHPGTLQAKSFGKSFDGA